MDIQIITFQLNLQKAKWLVISVYKTPAQNITYSGYGLSQITHFYVIRNEKQFIVENINFTPDDKSVK